MSGALTSSVTPAAPRPRRGRDPWLSQPRIADEQHDDDRGHDGGEDGEREGFVHHGRDCLAVLARSQHPFSCQAAAPYPVAVQRASPYSTRTHAREEAGMDWIERWFGLIPDGGDGSIEAAIVIAVIVVGVTIALVVSKRLRGLSISALQRLTRRRTKTAD